MGTSLEAFGGISGNLSAVMEICTFCQDLGGLLFRDTLDLLENSAWRIGNRLDRVIASIDNQLDVSLRETCYTLIVC